MTKRPGAPIPPRSSLHPDRRAVHLNLTALEYAKIVDRAAIAGLSRPRYMREAALALQIYRSTLPSDLLAHTTHAIACVRALARSLVVSQHPNTLWHLEAAMVELYDKDAELERHTEKIAAALALLPPAPLRAAVAAQRLPGPGSMIWRVPPVVSR